MHRIFYLIIFICISGCGLSNGYCERNEQIEPKLVSQIKAIDRDIALMIETRDHSKLPQLASKHLDANFLKSADSVFKNSEFVNANSSIQYLEQYYLKNDGSSGVNRKMVRSTNLNDLDYSVNFRVHDEKTFISNFVIDRTDLGGKWLVFIVYNFEDHHWKITTLRSIPYCFLNKTWVDWYRLAKMNFNLVSYLRLTIIPI